MHKDCFFLLRREGRCYCVTRFPNQATTTSPAPIHIWTGTKASCCRLVPLSYSPIEWRMPSLIKYCPISLKKRRKKREEKERHQQKQKKRKKEEPPVALALYSLLLFYQKNSHSELCSYSQFLLQVTTTFTIANHHTSSSQMVWAFSTFAIPFISKPRLIFIKYTISSTTGELLYYWEWSMRIKPSDYKTDIP